MSHVVFMVPLITKCMNKIIIPFQHLSFLGITLSYLLQIIIPCTKASKDNYLCMAFHMWNKLSWWCFIEMNEASWPPIVCIKASKLAWYTLLVHYYFSQIYSLVKHKNLYIYFLYLLDFIDSHASPKKVGY